MDVVGHVKHLPNTQREAKINKIQLQKYRAKKRLLMSPRTVKTIFTYQVPTTDTPALVAEFNSNFNICILPTVNITLFNTVHRQFQNHRYKGTILMKAS